MAFLLRTLPTVGVRSYTHPKALVVPLLIAIIDDEPSIIDFVRLFLEDEGYAVAAWGTEDGALAFIRETKPAALILDIQMETRDAGIRILECLRAEPETRTLPVVLSSGQRQFTAAQDERLRDLDYHVLPKPYKGGALLSMIQSVIAARV
jgi:CheY-like chemotaxis protein